MTTSCSGFSHQALHFSPCLGGWRQCMQWVLVSSWGHFTSHATVQSFEFKPWLCYLLGLWFWASYLMSLCLSPFTYKIKFNKSIFILITYNKVPTRVAGTWYYIILQFIIRIKYPQSIFYSTFKEAFWEKHLLFLWNMHNPKKFLHNRSETENYNAPNP